VLLATTMPPRRAAVWPEPPTGRVREVLRRLAAGKSNATAPGTEIRLFGDAAAFQLIRLRCARVLPRPARVRFRFSRGRAGGRGWRSE